mgnify:CR=1 FL=1
MPEKEQDSPESAPVSGTSSRESLARWDRATSSWRTSQLCLLEGSTPFSERWPTSGTMRSGQLYARPTWAPRTDASASSSSHGWPTPQSHDAVGGKTPAQVLAMRERTGAGVSNLNEVAETWATPTADDANNVTRTSGQMQSLARDTTAWATTRAEDGKRGKGSKFDGLSEDVTAWATPKARDYKDGDSTGAVERQSPDLGKEVVTFHRGTTPLPSEAQTAPSDSSPPKPRRRGLNPRFGLWLMGFPVAWLDSVPSGTPSSRKSRQSSGGGS